VGPRTDAENLAATGIRYPDRPARSQSLYRLRYPAHIIQWYRLGKIQKRYEVTDTHTNTNTHTHTHTQTYSHTNTLTHAHTNPLTQKHTQTHTEKYTHTHTQTNTHTQTHSQTHSHKNTHKHTQKNTLIHTNKHTHTHTLTIIRFVIPVVFINKLYICTCLTQLYLMVEICIEFIT